MKKIIAIALALVLCLSFMSMAAFAADTVTVYCQTPADWETCHVHYWNSASGDSTWPGVPMTKGANGIWSAQIPADVGGLLFNKEGDDGKTADLTLPTDGKLQYVIGGDWVMPGSVVEVQEKYFIAGTGSLCTVEWKENAPENAMTKGTDGIWVKEFKNVAAGEHKCKVTDGTWSNSWGDPNEAETNIVFTTTAASDVTIKFNASTKVITLIANGETKEYNKTEGDGTQPTEPSTTTPSTTTPSTTTPSTTTPSTTTPSTTTPSTTQPSTTTPSTSNQKYTLTVKVPASWTTVYVYTWDANGAPLTGQWPGSAMTKSGDSYKCTIPGNIQNIIINNGTVKTDDLPVQSGKNIMIVVADDCKATVTYPAGGSSTNTGANNGTGAAADPTPQGTLSNYRVVGNAAWMGNWQEANDAGRMVEVSPGVYKKNFENVEPGSYELKITKDGKWDGAYGGDNGGNYKFTVTQKCTITVTFTLQGTTGIISVKGTGVPATADISLVSVIVLMGLASAAVVVLFVNKKKFV